jgi:hypothetical protein
MCDVGVMDEVLLLKRVNESMKEAGIVLGDVREQETDFFPMNGRITKVLI